ncbi:MAG: PAS domain-containing protein, partial [Proteobacteria bacterium]|nr:PAS domain-containing protein [Pseudomonadota bacterium]
KRAPEDFVGKNHFDLYPDEENEQIFRNVVSSGEVFEISAKPFEHPDQPDRGTTYWDWSLAPVKDEKGKVQTLFLSLYDVTEKTQAELSLKEAEQDYIKVQEVAHFGSWNLDLVKNKLVWSDENYRIFGMPEDRSGNTYERFLEIVHPDDLEYVNRKWTAAVEENAPYDIEHRLLIKGEVRWVREVAKVVRDKQGVAVKGVGITQDITTRKQMEEQLQMRQRMDSLGTLAGGIAHDFNNILVSVLGNLELLSLDSGNFSEDQKECLVDAERGCFRATDLIRQIQSLSQGAVKGRAVIDPYNVSNEVFSLLRRTTDRLIEKQIGFNKGKFFVDADSGDLHQALLNLAMNSAQAIVEKGVCKSDFIRISADKQVAGENELSGLAEGDYVHISVEDNGTGMSAKTIS